MKKIIVYLSSILILINSLVYYRIPSYASEVSDDYKAIATEATWGNIYNFPYSFHKKYWRIVNPEGIPASTFVAPNYFYTSDQVTFQVITGSELIQLVLSRGLNIIMKPENAQALIRAFFAEIGPPKYENGHDSFVQGGVYDGNNNFLGYALNDISGCYYENLELNNYVIPSQTVNNVKEFYDYYTKDIYPDYITAYPPSTSFIVNHVNNPSNDVQYDEAFKTFVDENKDVLFGGDNTYTFVYATNSASDNNSFIKYYIPSDVVEFNDCYYIYDLQNVYWQNFCEYYDLKNGVNELLSSEFYHKPGAPDGTYIHFDCYDKNTNQLITNKNKYRINYRVVNSQREYYYTTVEDTSMNGMSLGRQGTFNNHLGYQFPIGNTFTVYKSMDIYNGIKNQTYSQDIYIGQNYQNYEVTSDNSINVTQTQINQATTDNSTIYNNITNNYYENVVDDVIDTNGVENTVNVQIEVVYPDNNPDNPDNPTDPDNPSDPDNPLEDDTILDAILKALKRFFDVIGKILGTVLAGLLEVIDSILEAIAGVMDGLGGITEFIGSLFSWIPEPVPQILGVGISICILAAIFKFIRG